MQPMTGRALTTVLLITALAAWSSVLHCCCLRGMCGTPPAEAEATRADRCCGGESTPSDDPAPVEICACQKSEPAPPTDAPVVVLAVTAEETFPEPWAEKLLSSPRVALLRFVGPGPPSRAPPTTTLIS